MAKILRCPACGALWQLEDQDDSTPLRCGACGALFDAAKAESVHVDDAVLEDFLTRKAQKAQEEAQGRAKMAELAAAMKDFDDLPASKSESEEPAAAADASKSRPSSIKGLLWGIAAVAAAAAAAGAAALLAHDAVLKQFPLLRPLYESVCTKAPCPGFVWSQPQAFEASASISADSDAKRPDVRMTLTNRSAYPQRLPIVEMKLLDPAGDTIALRILEPSDYGAAAPAGQAAVLPPGESFEALVHVETELPYDAAGAAVSPVTAPAP